MKMTGAANKSPVDATVQLEHADAVEEEARRDREPMHAGVLQPHGRRQGGVYRRGGDF